MKYSNPTQIKIGMKAAIAGVGYSVVGRVVLGVIEDGKTYYWNEYNLESATGKSATLVYEENEDGPQWKFFTLFEPQYPVSASGAAAMREGDTINLDGDNCRISRVDRSRVYFIEGKAPEDEKLNSFAHYFNATTGRKMMVVSWTNDEVECYRGMIIPTGVVASAFNLKKAALLKFNLASGRSFLRMGLIFNVALTLVVGLVFYALIVDDLPVSRARAITVFTAPVSSLEVGGEGTLEGKKYRIGSRALIEVSEPGLRFQRHEYYLTNDEGGSAILIQGIKPGTSSWELFVPRSPIEPLRPVEAASIPVGQIVNVDGVVAVVTELFRSKVILAVDGGDGTALKNDEVQYGFLGRKNETMLLVRWSANSILFEQGTAITEAAIKSAFGKSPPE